MPENLLYLAPLSCPDHVQFLRYLREFGINVLVIGAEEEAEIPLSVGQYLTSYRKVGDLSCVPEVIAAARDLVLQYGPIRWVESHTEHYLMLEGVLRECLQIPGKKVLETIEMRCKSIMKDKFREAGVAVADGMLVWNVDEALSFAGQTGYPVVLKPNDGMGSEGVKVVYNAEQLLEGFPSYPVPYFIEQFVDGHVVTYDGLVDRDGRIVYCNSLRYNNNLHDVVLSQGNWADYCTRDIPEDLEIAGKAVVEAYGLREKFFHLEFFRRTDDRQLIGLEVNMRPPGGPTIEMWNYADDINLYQEWARVLATGEFQAAWSHKYYVAFIGRRKHLNYQYADSEVRERWKEQIIWFRQINGLFKEVIGDTGYLLRSPEIKAIVTAIADIHKTKEVRKSLPEERQHAFS